MTLVICGTLIQNRTRIYIFSAKPYKVVVSVEHMKVLADDILGMSYGANSLPQGYMKSGAAKLVHLKSKMLQIDGYFSFA